VVPDFVILQVFSHRARKKKIPAKKSLAANNSMTSVICSKKHYVHVRGVGCRPSGEEKLNGRPKANDGARLRRLWSERKRSTRYQKLDEVDIAATRREDVEMIVITLKLP
jgi:hypothetical protein